MPTLLFDATTVADVVEVPPRTVIAIDGAGSPGGQGFQRAIGALYGVAYGLKFARKKKSARRDFKVGPLEGRWRSSVTSTWTSKAPPPPDTWRWRLRIAVPDDVSDADVRAVAEAAAAKKGGKLFGSAEVRRVRLEHVDATPCGRVLHVGPYAGEPASLAKVRATMEAEGVRPAREHVEIYLGDPRRTAPARLKTELLVPATAG